jgi:hypothetical protein
MGRTVRSQKKLGITRDCRLQNGQTMFLALQNGQAVKMGTNPAFQENIATE